MDLMEMYASMTIIAKGIALVLFIMSMWSLGVGIERFFTFNQATNQSKAFAPLVAKALKDGKVKDAIALGAKKEFRYSHLAKVVSAGLSEYQFASEAGTVSRDEVIDSVRRAIQRASAMTSSDLKKGSSVLATIGSTAPFVGLLGTVVGVINAFQGITPRRSWWTSSSARARQRTHTRAVRAVVTVDGAEAASSRHDHPTRAVRGDRNVFR